MGKPGRPDVVVIGAGIFGLAVAHACAGRGMRVVVLERGPRPGSGASGGPVGALAPHAPDRWSAASAFQLRALAGAGAFWRGIAAEAGRDPGFARAGRLTPLATARARERAQLLAAAARAHWPERFAWRVLAPGAVPAVIAGDAAPFGAVHETLSARIAPRRAVAALAVAAIARGAEIECGSAVTGLGDGSAATRAGEWQAGAVVLAAGAAALPGLAPAMAGDKGQAALLRLAGAGDWPLIQADGLWVVGHGDGTLAVGSTSERDWADPEATDAALDAVIARARALVPALAAVPVAERWAGLRPRARLPQPVIGRLPGTRRLLIAGGGYRIGLGLAPEAGAALARLIAGEPDDIPAAFAPETHGFTWQGR